MRFLLLCVLLLLLHTHLAVDVLGDYAVDTTNGDVQNAVDGVIELQYQDESVFNLMKAQVMNDLKLVGMLIPPQVKTYVVHVYGRIKSDGRHIIQGLVGEMLSTLGRLANKVSEQVVQFGEKMKENSEKHIKNDKKVEEVYEFPTVIEVEYTGGQGHSGRVEDEEIDDDDDYEIVEI